MVEQRWNYEAFQRIILRANAEGLDLETILLDELTRYLEGRSGVFTELVGRERVSLQAVVPPDVLAETDLPETLPLDELIERAEQEGLGLLELLALELETGKRGLEETLLFAFELGKRTPPPHDQTEA